MDMAKFKQELSDSIKNISEDPNVRVTEVGAILEFQFKVETVGGRTFERKLITPIDKAKDLAAREDELRTKAYEAAVAAIGTP